MSQEIRDGLAAQQKIRQKKLQVLNGIFFLSCILIFLAVFWLARIDTVYATLLGLGIVAYNLFASQTIFKRAFFQKHSKVLLAVVYFTKITASLIAIWVAIRVYEVDALGFVYGASALFLTALLYALYLYFWAQ